MVPTEYKRAERRVRESVMLRRDGLPHTYPRRQEDLDLMRRHHAEHGIPPAGLWARFKRWIGGGASVG
jgi:hypothetical protein